MALEISQDVGEATTQLSKKLAEVKGTIFSTVQRNHQEFLQAYEFTLDLKGEVESLARECAQVCQSVRDTGLRERLQTSTDEAATLHAQLKTTTSSIDVLRHICDIHQGLLSFQPKIDAGDYEGAAQAAQQMKECLDAIAPTPSSSTTSSSTTTAKGTTDENSVGGSVAEACAVAPAGTDPNIFNMLRREVRRRRNQLSAILTRQWSSAVVWSETNESDGAILSITSTSPSGSVPLAQVVGALDTLGALEPKLQAFVKTAMRRVFQPLVAHARPAACANSGKEEEEPEAAGTLVAVVRTANQTVTLRLEDATKAALSNSNSRAVDVFGELNTVLAMMQECLVGERAGMLGELLWGDLTALVVEGFLAVRVPETAGGLDAYGPTAAGAVAFEQRHQQDTRLAPSGDTTLSTYARNVNVHFGNKKRQQVLVTARQLMMAEDHNTVEVSDATERGGLRAAATGKLDKHEQKAMADLVATASRKHGNGGGGSGGKKGAGGGGEDAALGESGSFFADGMFRMPRCHVTQRTQTVVDMAYETMGEAATATPACAVQLFNTVRDLFDLFRACVPTHHHQSLETVPQLAMLFYNDCLYIAHHLLTLAHQFRAHFPAPLDSTATFVDMVPVFRQLGEECYLGQMRRQRTQLLEALATCDSLADTHEPERLARCERAVKQALHQLVSVGNLWSLVLPRDVFTASLGSLVDVCARRLCNDVLALTDISVEETHQLHYLLTLFRDKVPALFTTNTVTANAVDLVQAVPSWRRLNQTAVLLELGLADLIERWDGGRGDLDFSATEITALIKALFADTPLRARCLNSV